MTTVNPSPALIVLAINYLIAKIVFYPIALHILKQTSIPRRRRKLIIAIGASMISDLMLLLAVLVLLPKYLLGQ